MSEPPPAGLQHLAALTDDQRTVLELRVVQGLSAEDAALVTGSSVASVRSLQHEALEVLRDAIARDAIARDAPRG